MDVPVCHGRPSRKPDGASHSFVGSIARWKSEWAKLERALIVPITHDNNDNNNTRNGSRSRAGIIPDAVILRVTDQRYRLDDIGWSCQ
jgi:hypothetical protein